MPHTVGFYRPVDPVSGGLTIQEHASTIPRREARKKGMPEWIRKHRTGASFLAILALAALGGAFAYFYFNYCFTLKWAFARGAVQWSGHGIAAAYVYRLDNLSPARFKNRPEHLQNSLL